MVKLSKWNIKITNIQLIICILVVLLIILLINYLYKKKQVKEGLSAAEEKEQATAVELAVLYGKTQQADANAEQQKLISQSGITLDKLKSTCPGPRFTIIDVSPDHRFFSISNPLFKSKFDPTETKHQVTDTWIEADKPYDQQKGVRVKLFKPGKSPIEIYVWLDTRNTRNNIYPFKAPTQDQINTMGDCQPKTAPLVKWGDCNNSLIGCGPDYCKGDRITFGRKTGSWSNGAQIGNNKKACTDAAGAAAQCNWIPAILDTNGAKPKLEDGITLIGGYAPFNTDNLSVSMITGKDREYLIGQSNYTTPGGNVHVRDWKQVFKEYDEKLAGGSKTFDVGDILQFDDEVFTSQCDKDGRRKPPPCFFGCAPKEISGNELSGNITKAHQICTFPYGGKDSSNNDIPPGCGNDLDTDPLHTRAWCTANYWCQSNSDCEKCPMQLPIPKLTLASKCQFGAFDTNETAAAAAAPSPCGAEVAAAKKQATDAAAAAARAAASADDAKNASTNNMLSNILEKINSNKDKITEEQQSSQQAKTDDSQQHQQKDDGFPTDLVKGMLKKLGMLELTKKEIPRGTPHQVYPQYIKAQQQPPIANPLPVNKPAETKPKSDDSTNKNDQPPGRPQPSSNTLPKASHHPKKAHNTHVVLADNNSNYMPSSTSTTPGAPCPSDATYALLATL